MVTLRKLSQDHPDFRLVMKLYNAAFPLQERMDIAALIELNPATLLGIYTDRKAKLFAGFFVVIEDELMAYLLYFTTRPELYSSGIDGQALHALTEMFHDRLILLTYSACSSGNDAPVRELPRTLYLQNGFHECPWYVLYENSKYGLACSEESVDTVLLQHLLHKLQFFKSNFYTHSNT